MNTEFITLKEVKKKFHKNVVLDGINLDIPENKITAIIGASGEGKSTLLKLIMGFYVPNKGEVLYLKRNVHYDQKNMKRTFGFSTQDCSFYEKLTVKENLHHFGSLYNIKFRDIKKRAEELMQFVGLDKARRTRAENLSSGMRKRLDLACAIMHDPAVLLLDEPTSDLDPLLRKHILSLLTSIRDKGKTIIFTTQILEEVDSIADKVAILCNKKIVEDGSPKEICKKYNKEDLNDVFNNVFIKAHSDEGIKKARKYLEKKPAQQSSDKGKEENEVTKAKYIKILSTPEDENANEVTK